MKTLIVGNGGRESSIAMKLAEDSSVFAVIKHENTTILDYVRKSGGKYLVGDTNDPEVITNFATKEGIDLAFVSADDPLAAGVVDSLLEAEIRAVGPTKEGSEIEWNKEYANNLIQNILPEFSPKFWVANDLDSIKEIIEEAKKENIEIVVKPQGLTGGKGVKVMGEHLKSYNEAKEYAEKVLEDKIGSSESVIIVEKLEGIEFTIMAITDGSSVVYPPATYDYPFRFDGDKGPGTGGMGSFSDKILPLPFMTEQQYEKSEYIIEKVIQELKKQGRHFNGVLNTGLFLTKNGLKFMEFNARFGDPECMNTMTSLDCSFLDMLEQIYEKRLKPGNAKFKEKASVVKYLVAPEYSISSGKQQTFEMDVEKIESEGFYVFFSSGVATDRANHFSTVGTSRNVAIAKIADSIPEAAEKIDDCIERNVKGPLQYRKDIGNAEEILRLKEKGHGLRS